MLWRIGQVFRRRGQVGSSVACSVLAFVVPICGLMMLAAIGDDPSSLALMTSLPTYPFGAAGVFQWFVRNLPRALREPWIWLFLAPTVLTSIAVVRLRIICGVPHLVRDTTS